MEEAHSMQQPQGISDNSFRINPKSKGTKCLYIILLSFIILLTLIIYLSFFTSQQIKRINTVQGPITAYLPIFSGQLHYSRIPWQYWDHRIKMVKAMGFNTISVYIMWNFHEISKGKFDFQSPQKNLTRFLELAKINNMKVLIRPGPYVCAEWDFGGLPVRLLGAYRLIIRSHCPKYEAETKLYFTEVAKIIRPFLFKNGGNIIMLQIQNELGSLHSQRNHTQGLLKIWQQLNIQCEFYHQDAPWFWTKHYWPGAHVGLSQAGTLMDFAAADMSPKRQNTSLVFGGEIYTGWLTHWGEPMNGRDVEEFNTHFQKLVRANRSVSLYVAHGGTNFGLTAGANGFPNNDYIPHITSYDYDAPINEQGRPTQKYHFIRKLMGEYFNMSIPEIPNEIKSINIPAFRPNKIHSYLFANLPRPTLINGNLTYFQSDKLKMYNQGMVLYEVTLKQKKEYHFRINFRDFLLIYLDGQFQNSLARAKHPYSFFSVNCAKKECKMQLLVEAMGHINYGEQQKYDQKGIMSLYQIDQTVNSQTFSWNISKIPIDNSIFNGTKTQSSIKFPVILSGEFVLNEVGDTFFDMKSYKKGYIWINGNLLGRYWNIGPQQRLYCPGVWLKNGKNEFKILELLDNQFQDISGHSQGDQKESID